MQRKAAGHGAMIRANSGSPADGVVLQVNDLGWPARASGDGSEFRI